jgi:hypothetical protein
VGRWQYGYTCPVFNLKHLLFFCDDCVHRGCTCNYRYINLNEYDRLPTDEDKPYKWIEEGKVWTTVDEKNREWPCVEYEYEEEGFDCE